MRLAHELFYLYVFFSITFYPYQSTSDNYKLILRTLGGFMKNTDWGKVQIYYQKFLKNDISALKESYFLDLKV